ncbi:hypothetical protein AMS68_003705 [Peltaster fructicola]|uniref:Uncharacterized protein n=1 Tax=Peltaster fructicola TaxID=286661 RepID=A0A6H0XU97_9PEZI|nr:hypothetical protein AMS68_003705 [Peltaster fructicola]
MFIPPPTPSLSKAEIEHRRARLQQVRDGSPVPGTRPVSETKSAESGSPEASNALIRRIGIFGLGKDDKRVRSGFDISAPMLSPPSRGLPPVPGSFNFDFEQRSSHSPAAGNVKNLPPLPLPLKPVHSNEEPAGVLAGRQSPASPPRRPPRPLKNLSLENVVVSPSYQSPATRSSKHTRNSSSGSSVSFKALRRTSDRSMASSTSSQTLRSITRNGSARGSIEEPGASRGLLSPSKVKSSMGKSAARHVKKSSLEAALLGLGGVPEQSKPASALSIRATPYAAYQASLYQDRSLPKTPDSIVRSPRELYGAGKRTGFHVNHALKAMEELSPRQLNAIPENFSSNGELSPLPAGMKSPVKTRIHLRGGSVVTVTPPELDAWRRTVYVQGPIRLTKPAIIPRKNSLASLEPFQEAVDQVYQDALRSSRRRSDEAAAKEICDFFLDFGTCDIYPRGGSLDIQEEGLSESEEEVYFDVDLAESPSLTASTLPRAALMPVLDLPPVETEETLRARGIARLMKGRQQTSKPAAEVQGLRKADSVLTLVPLPEDSILDAVLARAVTPRDRDRSTQRTLRTQEGDSSAPWISSGNMHRAAAIARKRYSQ